MVMPKQTPNCIECKEPLPYDYDSGDCIDYTCDGCHHAKLMGSIKTVSDEVAKTIMTVRPPFELIYMNLALELAQRSTCSRLSVGCVVTSADYSHVYGIGYNGNAKGLPNRCDSDEPGKCGCLHAEDNALLKVSEPSYVEKILFCTHQPCAMCAKRIVNKGGLIKVYYMEPYRLPEGLEVLKSAGIETYRWTRDVG